MSKRATMNNYHYEIIRVDNLVGPSYYKLYRVRSKWFFLKRKSLLLSDTSIKDIMKAITNMISGYVIHNTVEKLKLKISS